MGLVAGMRKIEPNQNIATLGLISSIIIFLLLNLTKSYVTIDYITRVEPNIYLIVAFRVIWYLSMFIFLQSAIIITNGKYDERESNKIFLLQVGLILFSEFWAMLESLI